MKIALKSVTNRANPDVITKKTMNLNYSYFIISAGDSVYFVFVAKENASEEKIQALYYDIKRDFTMEVGGNL